MQHILVNESLSVYNRAHHVKVDSQELRLTMKVGVVNSNITKTRGEKTGYAPLLLKQKTHD